MRFRSRSFIMAFLLTLAASFAAMHLDLPFVGVQAATANLDGCPNTGCHGWEMCKYTSRSSCSLAGPNGPCTATRC